VKPGDTLSGIAHRFRVSVAAIVARNHLANPDRVADGQTLLIPPRPPLALVVTPTTGPAGKTFMFRLVGAKPAEVITFQVRSPRGTFRGPAHTATTDGSVTTTYQTASSDRTGIYTVTAHGKSGTNISARFTVLPPTTPAT
jgi:LysM repeat protein